MRNNSCVEKLALCLCFSLDVIRKTASPQILVSEGDKPTFSLFVSNPRFAYLFDAGGCFFLPTLVILLHRLSLTR